MPLLAMVSFFVQNAFFLSRTEALPFFFGHLTLFQLFLEFGHSRLCRAFFEVFRFRARLLVGRHGLLDNGLGGSGGSGGGGIGGSGGIFKSFPHAQSGKLLGHQPC